MTRASAPVPPPGTSGTVVVTGASAGIGRELARCLAPRASTLVLVARRTERLEQLRDELTEQHPGLAVLVLAADLSRSEDLDRLLGDLEREAGPVDLLVNNAGIGVSDLFDRTPWDRTSDLLATNVVALVRLTHALVPGMVARGRGGVLNLGSGAGLTVMPAAVAYGASKHFVHGFSATLRADLAGTGVVVTEVCPGPVESEFDAAAGNPDGLTGGPPAALTITAAECAREAVAGLDRGAAVVYPGRAYRLLMRVRPLLPGALVRRQAAKGAQQLRAAR